jgi:hypothetical protein
MSGPPPKSSRSEALTPFNAHPHKKVATTTTTQPVAATNDEDPVLILSGNESAGTEENIHESTCESAGSDSEQLDLKTCTDVRYEKRDGMHGVVVRHNDEQTWTPVYGRRRKRVPLSEAQLRRIPAHCRPPPPSESDDSSTLSESEIPLTVPDNHEC